jgi:hypothetical protein
MTAPRVGKHLELKARRGLVSRDQEAVHSVDSVLELRQVVIVQVVKGVYTTGPTMKVGGVGT